MTTDPLRPTDWAQGGAAQLAVVRGRRQADSEPSMPATVQLKHELVANLFL
jgi:hypothetical protein